MGAIAKLPELTSFHLNLEGCMQVSSVATLIASVGHMSKLKQLHLDLRFVTGLNAEGAAELCQTVVGLEEQLQSLMLKMVSRGQSPYWEDFENVAQVKDAIEVAKLMEQGLDMYAAQAKVEEKKKSKMCVVS